MSWLLGMDGGGSGVRVGIFTPDLTPLAEVTGDTVNPSLIGQAESARRIQHVITEALKAAGLSAGDITAAGVGIAGAASTHSQGWLRAVITTALPDARAALSADYEIALVGAHGQRLGALLLAGTGSLAYGVNAEGESALVGGWGYLIGDEGGGYWLGAQALRAAVRASDGRDTPTALTAALLQALRLEKPINLIPWLYRSASGRTREVAALAPLVLRCADEGDVMAGRIIHAAAEELARAARTVCHRLGMAADQVAFAGSLLTHPNPLSRRVCAHLNLMSIPQPRYRPVVGAALLARDAL